MQFISDFHAQIPPPNFSVGLNKYSADLPEDHKGLTGNRPNSSAATNVGFERFSMGRMLQSLPASIDWEALGAMTYVKDQVRSLNQCVFTIFLNSLLSLLALTI